MDSGEYPADTEALAELVMDVCYNNAKNFFGFKLFLLCFKYLFKIFLKFSYVNLIPEISEKYLTKRFLKCIIVSVQ